MLSVGSVDVRFTNDSCSGCGGNPVGGGDRNLFINSVTIDSTSIPPNDPSVSYVTPPCNEYANGVGQLLCNGDMIVNKSLGAPGQTITVNAYGSTDYNIYPHMQLLLNGVILGEWDVTGSGQNYSVTIPSSSILYYGEDLLGTSRVITTNTGVVCYDADFYPYGGERPYTNTCPQNYKFEGKERDSETSIGPGNTNGNDDFGARYYSNRFGRWLSADWSAVPVAVPYANLTNPQTLNLYAMVADDPESFADLDGHTCDQQSGKGCFWQKLWHGLMGVGFRTNTEVANAATTARKNLEGKGTLNSDSGEVKIYSKDDLAKMSDRQVLLLQDELNGLAKNGITQDQINAINAIVMTQWGWSGTKPYRDAMNQLKQAGTHENLGGKVPTREEATRMIRESGGLVERQDPGHTPGGVSTHTEPHINYTTASGEKATVIVRE